MLNSQQVLHIHPTDNVMVALQNISAGAIWLCSFESILEYCIQAASGAIIPKAVGLLQDEFIPWKRGVSL